MFGWCRPGATRIESFGSVWFIDDDANEYLRMPKREGPRECGPNGEDWGGPDAGEMQDLVWHPMFGWERGTPYRHWARCPHGAFHLVPCAKVCEVSLA